MTKCLATLCLGYEYESLIDSGIDGVSFFAQHPPPNRASFASKPIHSDKFRPIRPIYFFKRLLGCVPSVKAFCKRGGSGQTVGVFVKSLGPG